jgi:hypothetical protein
MTIQVFAKVGRFVDSDAQVELFDAEIEQGRLLKHSLPSNVDAGYSGKRKAIEVFVPRGGAYWAGVLGAQVEPTKDHTLEIVVRLGGGVHSQGVRSNINSGAQFQVQMIEEFAAEIIGSSIKVAQSLPSIAMGRLTFDVAAINDGSSAFVFQRLGRAITRVMLDTSHLQVSNVLSSEFFES